MRVLILTQHYVPEVTAGRFRLEASAEELAPGGHEVEVICPDDVLRAQLSERARAFASAPLREHQARPLLADLIESTAARQ